MNRTIALGSIPKIRGTYTNGVIYFRENLVTMCGSLFQCIVSDTTNTPPLAKDEEYDDRFYSVKQVNSSVWRIVIDNIKSYNDLQYFRSLGMTVDDIETDFAQLLQDVTDRMPHYVYEDEWKVMTDAQKNGKLWYILKGNKPTEDDIAVSYANGVLTIEDVVVGNNKITIPGTFSNGTLLMGNAVQSQTVEYADGNLHIENYSGAIEGTVENGVLTIEI